ncbi:phosphocholine-specific phospholipase C [Rhodoplanes sp. Z2-YC6860]|uniref:phosphocholine-specific phospholipase C n=1 Tax=Rhodoplanes sp. Z2-YC6860 TaxID=674703 RepID=UPI00078B89F7|nr:phospholipase C, phosphocholine-specific [Rhodoplanes sp. Z2-YC6860]AMN44985.1 non-hemolytic phospholipase C [Rhodoplanes sp. Z2-YC6860]
MTTRRNFLAGVAAATAFPSINRALAIPAMGRTGTIKDIKHIVILMQENRGFDHYFGTMKGVRGFGDRFPIPLESGKPVWAQSDGTREIPPYHRDATTSNALVGYGTPHAYADSQAAWNQGKMGYWPKYKSQYSMGYFKREDIPFQFALAEAFTLCDAYHCSITTGTDPNRITFWSGSNFNPALRAQGINCTTADGEPNNLRCWPSPSKWVDGLPQPQPNYTYVGSDFNWDTLPDLLQRAGISWHIYQDMNNNWTGAMHGGLAFSSFRHAQPNSPVYVHGLTGGPDYLDKLKADVMAGTLPQVSWVLPTQANSEHPGGGSPTRAGNFTDDVLNALTSNPEVWSQTAFFLTFDENDGFFDHLPPPAVPSYDINGNLMGKATLPLAGEYFDSTGFALNAQDTISGKTRPWGLSARVPMYVVSPWSKGGWVNSQVFDHTSVGRFLEKRFGIKVDAISPWHRAISGDLTTAFDFARPNDPRFPELPDQSGWAASDAHQKTLTAPVPPATPQPLFQEPGVRYSRALPYLLHASAQVDARKGTVRLLFANTGFAGAVFHVYDQLHLDRIPRRYTVEAGQMLDDEWAIGSDGTYDLWVLGPNGFHRTFGGDLSKARPQNAPNPEIFVGYNVHDGGLHLQLRNNGNSHLRFTVKSNKIYGPLLAVSPLVSAAAMPESPGFGPLPGLLPVSAGPLLGFRPAPDLGAPGFGFGPPLFTPGPSFGNGPDTSWDVKVPASGHPRELYWNLRKTGFWYDFIVTSDSDSDFERRLAGHVETGRASVSDPGMGMADRF